MIDIFKNNKINYNEKVKKLQNKVKDWKIDNRYKQEYIHLHLAYYYVKNGLFKNDYCLTIDSPKSMPEKIEVMFNELNNWKNDLDDWLIKYL